MIKNTEKAINKDEAVKQLLYYMENTVYENAVNEDLREIHRIIYNVHKNPILFL